MSDEKHARLMEVRSHAARMVGMLKAAEERAHGVDPATYLAAVSMAPAIGFVEQLCELAAATLKLDSSHSDAMALRAAEAVTALMHLAAVTVHHPAPVDARVAARVSTTIKSRREALAGRLGEIPTSDASRAGLRHEIELALTTYTEVAAELDAGNHGDISALARRLDATDAAVTIADAAWHRTAGKLS